MKSNILKLAVAIVLTGAVLLTACEFNIAAFNPAGITRVTGSGHVVAESRSVSGFSGLVVNGAGKVSIDRTGAESLSVTADDNLLQYIVTEVRGGKLVIEFKHNVVTGRVTALSFSLTVQDLNSIELNGAAAVDAKNMVSDRLVVNVSGAGGIKLAGQVNQQDVLLNGTGAYDAENVEGKRATVTNNGAGFAVVRVSDELDATINGVGYIEYIGSPKVTKTVNGLGAIRRR
jgi:hypothetical protein